MKKTTTIIMAAMAFLFSQAIKAQDATPPTFHEFGIGVSGITAYSLNYIWGSDNKFYRFSITPLTFSGSNSSQSQVQHDTSGNYIYNYNSTSSTPVNLSAGFNFGFLWAKKLADRVDFIYGGILGGTFSYNDQKITETNTYTSDNSNSIVPDIQTSDNKTQTWRPYVGGAIGIRCTITSNLIIYGEIDPNVYFSYSKAASSGSDTNLNTINGHTYSHTFGTSIFSNSIVLAYRITK